MVQAKKSRAGFKKIFYQQNLLDSLIHSKNIKEHLKILQTQLLPTPSSHNIYHPSYYSLVMECKLKIQCKNAIVLQFPYEVLGKWSTKNLFLLKKIFLQD